MIRLLAPIIFTGFAALSVETQKYLLTPFSLAIFRVDIVFNILHDSLVFLYRDKNLIEENYGKILFSNDEELQKCIDYFTV